MPTKWLRARQVRVSPRQRTCKTARVRREPHSVPSVSVLLVHETRYEAHVSVRSLRCGRGEAAQWSGDPHGVLNVFLFEFLLPSIAPALYCAHMCVRIVLCTIRETLEMTGTFYK